MISEFPFLSPHRYEKLATMTALRSVCYKQLHFPREIKGLGVREYTPGRAPMSERTMSSTSFTDQEISSARRNRDRAPTRNLILEPTPATVGESGAQKDFGQAHAVFSPKHGGVLVNGLVTTASRPH